MLLHNGRNEQRDPVTANNREWEGPWYHWSRTLFFVIETLGKVDRIVKDPKGSSFVLKIRAVPSFKDPKVLIGKSYSTLPFGEEMHRIQTR